MFLGSASGVADGSPANAHAQIESDQSNARLGWNVASAGDVNGDGYADVIVGAYGYDNTESDEGAAFVFHGNGNATGRSVLARQIRTADTTPVQAWGASDSAEGFRVRMQATHPEGRGRVKLEVERCGPGVAFGDPSCPTYVSPTWSDSGTSGTGVTLTETIPIPFGETLARARAPCALPRDRERDHAASAARARALAAALGPGRRGRPAAVDAADARRLRGHGRGREPAGGPAGLGRSRRDLRRHHGREPHR